jgi:hypothetical protein
MESDKIILLVTKYFEGETTLAEEKILKEYFSSTDIASNLVQYQPLFAYLSNTSKQEFEQKMPLFKSNNNPIKWLSIAASVVVLLGIGFYTFNNYSIPKTTTELGTYDDPQVAFEETQKALALLSNHVNVGIESVRYVETYEVTRDKIFISEN